MFDPKKIKNAYFKSDVEQWSKVKKVRVEVQKADWLTNYSKRVYLEVEVTEGGYGHGPMDLLLGDAAMVELEDGTTWENDEYKNDKWRNAFHKVFGFGDWNKID